MTFHFELVAPERLMFSGNVESVVLDGTEGQMTVLADQAPSMTTLKPGVVTVEETAGKVRKLFVRGGFADISVAGLTILADTAIPLEELDAKAIEAQIKGAEDDLAAATLDESKRLASEKVDQLRELKAALAL